MALLVVVIASYRQTCHAYPNGGGAYAVRRANFGQSASLVAALMNLRGIKESGAVFAIPTYGFVLCVFSMLAVGLLRTWLGSD